MIAQSLLSTTNLSIGYGKTTVQTNLNLSLAVGEMVCILGRNGCGKSTLLRTIAGLQPALSGQILMNNGEKNISKLTAAEKAHLFSLVLTERESMDNTLVRDIVAMGRYPYTGFMGHLTKTDDTIVTNAIEAVGISTKQYDYFNQLSDGEKQRVLIAKAIAQQTPLILLDEPTAHLDLPNRIKTMLLLRQLAHEQQKSILISTHDLDIALHTADTIWLMKPLKSINTEHKHLNTDSHAGIDAKAHEGHSETHAGIDAKAHEGHSETHAGIDAKAHEGHSETHAGIDAKAHEGHSETHAGIDVGSPDELINRNAFQEAFADTHFHIENHNGHLVIVDN